MLAVNKRWIWMGQRNSADSQHFNTDYETKYFSSTQGPMFKSKDFSRKKGPEGALLSMLGLKVVPEPRQGDPVDLRPKLSFHLTWQPPSQHFDVGPTSALVCIVVFGSRHRANVGIPSPALSRYVDILSERGGWCIVVCRRFLSGLWWLKLKMYKNVLNTSQNAVIGWCWWI